MEDAKTLSPFWYNECVQVLAPAYKKKLMKIFNDLDEQKIVYANNLPLSSLLEEQFIEGFLRQGNTYMVCVDRKLNYHDSACLLPSGVLLLHLTEETFTGLGLPGRRSHEHKTKWVVQLDLLSQGMAPDGTKLHKTHEALAACTQLTVSAKLKWIPNDSEICGSSLLDYLVTQGVDCCMAENTHARRRWMNCQVPAYHHDDTQREDVFEWLGDVSCDAEVGHREFEYECPEPHDVVEHMTYMSISNLITPEDVHQLLHNIRALLKEEAGIPWIALMVHGFKDTPVLLGNRESPDDPMAENVQSQILFKDSKTWYDELIKYGNKCIL